MQNIWNKLEKSSKTGQDKKSLISGRETGQWAMSPPKFEIFLICAFREATRVPYFAILDIAFRFTCG